jgi:hypothetical protein
MKPIANINYATGFWGSGGNTFVFKNATPNPNDLNNYDPDDVRTIFPD